MSQDISWHYFVYFDRNMCLFLFAFREGIDIRNYNGLQTIRLFYHLSYQFN